jgi:hypothetical protein
MNFDEEIQAIRNRLKKAALEAADYAMKQLAFKFSPVWTGTYVSSHRVGIDGKTDSGYTNRAPINLLPGQIPQKADPAAAILYREQAASRVREKINIKNMPNSGKIIIYNQCPMALEVEVLPDKYLTGNMSPYMPYKKTEFALWAQLPAIIERTK